MDPLISALRNIYGWDAFKPGQREVIEAILSGQDAVAVLPTGGGKSLCYQLPASLKKGIVVVISPLIALMEDQVRSLKSKNVSAIAIHSGLNKERIKQVYLELEKNIYNLLYLSPERLKSQDIRALIQRKANEGKLVAIAIDEAHCISAWGHDFRPDYRRLGELRCLFPNIPLLALSATAPPKVRADMIRLLKLRKPLVQVCSAARNNLNYSMRRRAKDPIPEMLEVINRSRGASLIYVRTRRSVQKWTVALKEQGIRAVSYHAGLSLEERKKALTYFLDEENPVLVATVAFGMGVDRKDVGLVLHLNLPSTPEGYLQESGRAGRDGLSADCLVLFSPGDRTRLGWAIQTSFKENLNESDHFQNQLRSQIAQEQLRRMEAIAEGHICREQALLLAIGEISSPCGRCDNCNAISGKKDCSLEVISLLSEIKKNDGVDIHALSLSLSNGKKNHKEGWGRLARKLVQEELILESNDGAQKLFILESGCRFIDQPWLFEIQA